MTTEYNASEIDRLVREGRDAIDRRGECAGPLTTFDRERDTSTVGIICRDNWDDVIRWLACCERVFPQALAALSAAKAEVERLTDALTKISAIRDSIVGCQGFNFSEHAYPLVAVLDAAGFKGAGYEIASKNLGTLIERATKAEAENTRLAAEVERLTKERDERDMQLKEFAIAHGVQTAGKPGRIPTVEEIAAHILTTIRWWQDQAGGMERARDHLRARVEQLENEAIDLSARVRELELTEFDNLVMRVWADRLRTDPTIDIAFIVLLDRLVKGGRNRGS